VTVHRLGEPFLEFPGALPLLEKRVKTPTAPWQTALAGAEPNPWVTGKTGRVVRLDAALGLQFAQKEIVASPGERLTLNFHNPDAVPHNFLLAKPEALARLGDLANKMITDPEGPVRHYVPRSEDVLVYTDMVAPGGKFTIHFDAPVVKGNYPYLCTFPGHWMVMNGVLRVE
jgi:azurin